MYKVLIVDDERIIRESISLIIDWNAYGFELIGAAANGIEALRIVYQMRPELIITDLKMPMVSGNQLAEKVKSKYPDTEIVILSGYDDFTLASESMKHGVRHYLLKPCSEKDIIEVLLEVKKRLNEKEERGNFIRKNNEKLEKMAPLVKEQFTRDFIMSKHYSEEEMSYFMDLFNIDSKEIRLVLAKPGGDYSFQSLFDLTNTIKKSQLNKSINFMTVINKNVIICVEKMDEKKLKRVLEDLMEKYKYLNSRDIVITYSKEGPLEDVSQMFYSVQKYLNAAFYFGPNSLISYRDVEEELMIDHAKPVELEALTTAVRFGNKSVFEAHIKDFFNTLSVMKPSIDTFKFYSIELASRIMSQCPPNKSYAYLKEVMQIQDLDSFEKMNRAILDLGNKIVEENYTGLEYKQNKIIETMLYEINQRYSDENLTLKCLAHDVMFMNSGYLSKLFCKETGITFSSYLTKLRMEKSKEIIEKSSEIKVYEVASQIGMGNNPQYFSQLFKKIYGVTPTEYKNIHCEKVDINDKYKASIYGF